MYKATIVEVFIASPSDVQEERKLIQQLINEWNIINTKTKKIMLRSISWENDVYSSFGGSPQSIINKQILDNSDLLIGVFKSRLGSPTEEHESGTVEEIKRHTENNKPAMIFFSNEYVDPKKFDHEQYNKLQEFKDWAKKCSLYCEYKNKEEFKDLLRTQIGLTLNTEKYFQTEREEYIQKEVKLTQSQEDLILFLSNLEKNRNNGEIDVFINKIGSYRFKRILPILKELDILNAEQTLSGFAIKRLSGYYECNERIILDIIESIKKGEIVF